MVTVRNLAAQQYLMKTKVYNMQNSSVEKLPPVLHQYDVMSSVFAFARWLDEYGWKIDLEDGCWFRECEDELTPDISVEYTDEMVWEMFLKHCS